MHHRSKRKVFDRKDGSSSIITTSISSLLQKLRTPSTFTLGKNPHLIKNKLHSKSTYFYRWGSKTKLSAKFSYVIPSVCTLALLVGGVVTVNPIINRIDEANAVESEPAVQADGVPSLSLNLISGAAYQQTNAEVGKIAYRSNIFEVGGTGMVNYLVSLNTASGKTGELVGKNNPYATVGKVGTNTIPDGFEDNTWGYAVSVRDNTSIADSDMVYNPIPSGTEDFETSVKIAERNGISSVVAVADKYKITFAAKLGNWLPADHYEADVYLSVVASAQATISDITTMQEMNNSICSASVEHETKQLRDTRDGKVYWVAKLKDGNCWMTQNLDYNGGGGSVSISNWPSSGNNAFSGYYDPGNYVYNVGANGQNGDCAHKNYFSQCSTQFSAVSDSSNLHYHVGNYYSWNAATNGTGGSITSGEASDSVCPDGWKLPRSGNDASSGSFDFLLSQYGIQKSLVNGDYAIYGDPIYFIYGGTLVAGQFDGAGRLGWYWSSTPSSNNDNSYMLSFTDMVSASYDVARYRGASVRCLFTAISGISDAE